MRTYGTIYYKEKLKSWIIESVEPHVAIKLKSVFPKIAKTSVAPFKFSNSPETCSDLAWFMSRYPLNISNDDIKIIEGGRSEMKKLTADMETILMPDYVPGKMALKDSKIARNYQMVAKEMFSKVHRYLLGDSVGLGKTVSAILCCMVDGALPAAVVVQAHLVKQWKEAIEEFTHMKVHAIKSTNVYNLPVADIYIFTYHKLIGWVSIFGNGNKDEGTNFFKCVVYDESSELRRRESSKYSAAKVLANNANFVIGLSGSPIFNYGNEIFNVMNIIKPECLGTEEDFLREWTTNGKLVKDPQALGAYLRDNYLMLRRTRADVGRELPPVNKIIHTVDYDHNMAEKAVDIARQLAIKVTTGSFIERGQASRELDTFARLQTGVAKAHYVAEFVKLLLDSGEPVLLAGYHHDCYSIWKEELIKYNPVFYTGVESPKQKDAAKDAFINGDTDLMIISIRSGIGIDGLQKRCKILVIAELDWSGAVLEQLIGRLRRDSGGNEEQVTVFYLVSDEGSDPIMMKVISVKNSQSHGIIDPNVGVVETYSDESRIKMLAEYYLNKHKVI